MVGFREGNPEVCTESIATHCTTTTWGNGTLSTEMARLCHQLDTYHMTSVKMAYHICMHSGHKYLVSLKNWMQEGTSKLP